MKFTTQTDQLLIAVTAANRFVERRANLTVLSTVLIVAENNQLVLRATNIECGVEVVVPAKVEIGGVVAVPATTLLGFLSNARGKGVTASLVGEMFTIETERVSATIKTIPHEDFPVLPRVSAENSFVVKSSDLARAIRSVAYCASTSTVKPELQSVLLYAEAGVLVAVATDSFRLAEKKVPLKGGGTVPNLLIPARNAAELMKILDTESGDVEIYYNENQLATHYGAMYYTSRLMDGSFPNYRQILPKEFTTEAVVLREDISSSLKSLSIFADKFAQVSIHISPSEKALLLSSRNPDVGEQTSTVRATISGDDLTISFNGRYVADSLQAIVGESVRLQVQGPGRPMVIRDSVDTSFLYLAMPMNR